MMLVVMTSLTLNSAEAATLEAITSTVTSGQWQIASNLISSAIESRSLSATERQEVLFQQDRMRRIALDFTKSKADILVEAQRIAPGTSEADITRWEADGAIESILIDGKQHYFNRAAANVFRIHPEARERKASIQPGPDPDIACWMTNAAQVLQAKATLKTKRYRVKYTLKVQANTVPPGETIRAWLPYPHRSTRQTDVRLISTIPPNPLVSPATNSLSCLYLEQPAVTNEPTTFTATFEFSTHASLPNTPDFTPTSPSDITPSDFLYHVQQRPPHIPFTPELRRLSDSIIGRERNPAVIASKLFTWVSQNIPWAGAREYSTLESLTDYALTHRHGDCGIQTMLFITLCRLNGIPARWESGWMVLPSPNLHDWCRIYLPNQGWIPVDVSYGLMPTDVPELRLFYLGGFDGDRMIVNTDYDQPLYPPKQFFRSEVVDFQRGEVEWRGGNLYFDQWDYHCEFTEIPTPSS